MSCLNLTCFVGHVFVDVSRLSVGFISPFMMNALILFVELCALHPLQQFFSHARMFHMLHQIMANIFLY